MNNKILVLLFTAFLFSYCKRQITPLVQEKGIPETNFKLDEISFSYLSAKAKINYKDKDNNINATLNLRIRKDSIIWLSLVPALGIEATRCLITTDSVFLLDRLNNAFYAYDFNTLSRKINLNLNYSIIESIFLGNLPIKRKSTDSLSLLAGGNYYFLFQKTPEIESANYINILTSKLERVQLKDLKDHRELHIVYSNFLPLSQFQFANTSLINLIFPKNAAIESTFISIQYNKVEFPDKPLNFPFNLPAKFIKK